MSGNETGSGAGDLGDLSKDGGDVTGPDRLRRRVLWSMPTGLYVVGSRSGSRRNLMTANLCVQVSVEPKLVGVAVDAGAVTAGLITDGRCFSVSFLARDDRAVVRHFVKPVPASEIVAGPDGEPASMAGEAVLAAHTGAPILARAVAWLDCVVCHRLELGSHHLFVGEVVAVGGPRGEVPAVLRMEDTRMHYGG